MPVVMFWVFLSKGVFALPLLDLGRELPWSMLAQVWSKPSEFLVFFWYLYFFASTCIQPAYNRYSTCISLNFPIDMGHGACWHKFAVLTLNPNFQPQIQKTWAAVHNKLKNKAGIVLLFTRLLDLAWFPAQNIVGSKPPRWMDLKKINLNLTI